jgi:chaperone required for assembly of F1-ATPase
MRDIFDKIAAGAPRDPLAASRQGMRPVLRRRFYQEVSIAEGDGACGVQLDGRSVKTPAHRLLAAPTRALAEALAAEWRAQGEAITPALLPLTRLADSIIDGVAEASEPVAREVGDYLACDLLLYRAASPQGLVERQAQAWDPVIDWARAALGATFVTGTGLRFVAQSADALAAARSAIPRDASNANDLWRLGALHSITTLTGSALLALALLKGRLTAEAAWSAAHVDEDWNMEQWGRDELALARRAARFAEMQAATAVLTLLQAPSRGLTAGSAPQ